MYLRSGNRYNSGRNTVISSASEKSSEESVTNAHQVLEPIVEDETLSESTSSMSSEMSTADAPEYSMTFNVRLAFAWTNAHEAQLYKDPMNGWIVMIEEQPMAFDPAPWVNYEGDTYMGQEGVRYIVTRDPDNVDKWG